MAYTLPPIAVTGEIITAAWGNDVRNALAVLKTGLTADVGSFRATLNGTAAVDTGIARPALVNANGQDEWGMVNFGDYTTLTDAAAILTADGNTYRSLSVTGAGGLGSVVTIRSNQNTWLYVGSLSTFNGIDITFSTPNSAASNPAVAEYWNGSSWVSVTVVDGTHDGTRTFAQDGLISWTPPDDWAQTTVNGVSNTYWIRLRPGVGGRNHINSGTAWSRLTVEPTASSTGSHGRDAEWPIIRLNDLHDTNVCPAVSAGDKLDRYNSLVFADAVADGEDAYLAVLSNGNLAIGVSAAGVHALPFSIKTLKANRLA